jgi:hypothetical protein
MSAARDVDAEIRRFGAGLQALVRRAAIPSLRGLARRAHFSHTTVAEAVGGRNLPTLEVLLAIVAVCEGDPVAWEDRWRRLDHQRRTLDAHRNSRLPPAEAASPWEEVAVADGADPDEAGCSADAVTVHARRIALRGERRIIGVVELRYSPSAHAAWGRFKGYPLLDKLADSAHSVDVMVDVARSSDGRRGPFELEYSFDYHWGDLVLTGTGEFFACATVKIDGNVVAYGETNRVSLE